MGTCLDIGGTVSGHPPRTEHCFLTVLSQLSPPLTGGETEARGDSALASRAVGGEEIYVGSREEAG